MTRTVQTDNFRLREISVASAYRVPERLDCRNERLVFTPTATLPPVFAAAPKAKAAKSAKAAGEPEAPREGTAKANVLAMIQRKGGATLDEIGKATGWQKHTIRGFMSVVPKKAGLTVTSTRREDGARVYEAK